MPTEKPKPRRRMQDILADLDAAVRQREATYGRNMGGLATNSSRSTSLAVPFRAVWDAASYTDERLMAHLIHELAVACVRHLRELPSPPQPDPLKEFPR